jgi:hypothetical protein
VIWSRAIEWYREGVTLTCIPAKQARSRSD